MQLKGLTVGREQLCCWYY